MTDEPAPHPPPQAPMEEDGALQVRILYLLYFLNDFEILIITELTGLE